MERWTAQPTRDESLFLVQVVGQGTRRRSYYAQINADGSLAWVKRLPQGGGTVPLDAGGPTAAKVFAAVRKTIEYRHRWG